MGDIGFVGIGETPGYPYLVCKKFISRISPEWLCANDARYHAQYQLL